VKRYRRLRRLQPDPELIRRRAAGETFRQLAPAYGVSHSTLSRYFARPEVAKQLKQAVRAGQPAAAASRKRYRRLRRLQPDAELLRRRAAGESFRELAPAYGVSHTTLSRYFARPEVVQALRAEKRQERKLHRQVSQQAAAERERVRRGELAAGRLAERRSRRRAGGAYAAWLDERDARLPLTRADLHSRNDLAAAHTVAAGGGMQAVIEATGLRTRKNVLNSIDPAILEQAFQNDAATKRSRGPRRTRPR
jgi:hypothetical protein